MSLLGNLETSSRNQILSNSSLRLWIQTSSFNQGRKSSPVIKTQKGHQSPDSSQSSRRAQCLGRIFINSLVQASSFSHQQAESHHLHRISNPYGIKPNRRMHTIARSRTKSEAGNKSQFINLLDYYSDEPRPMDFLPIAEAPNWRQPYTEDTSDIESPERTSTKWVPRDEHEKNAIRAVGKAITNIKTSEDSLFELYRTLPAPRASFLTPGKLHKLLHRLSVVERKSETTMLRFFSVIDDMRTSGIPLTTNEWNSAIAFAGRHNTRVSDRQIESALQIWKNMEEGSKKKGTEVTFNILYDVASRAGKFGLASMIKEEMKAQKMPKTRFNFVSTIQACGFQGDAQGVRDTYRQMVEEGEIIDTAVLNTVISAIIRCGEPTAAEQIYERMKRLHASRTESTSPRHSWREARTLGRYLKKAALQTREDPALRKTVQDQISISPDLRTYRILVLYHCMVSGRLDRVATLVDEMRSYRVPLHGSIFLYLFKGFTRHGGVRYTDWTVEALERVWTAYMSALGHEEGVVLGKWIFVWALRAFSKISDKERVESIWASVREHRHASKEELQAAELLLHSISK